MLPPASSPQAEEVKMTLACEEDAVAPAECNLCQTLLSPRRTDLEVMGVHCQRGCHACARVPTGSETKHKRNRHDSPLTGRRASVIKEMDENVEV